MKLDGMKLEGTKLEKDPKEICILVVDDEPDLVEIISYSLQRQGYQVLSASNGREAYRVLESKPVDIVITDVRMPEGDGIELLNRTKDRSADRPIVLLISGYTDLSREEAYNQGAEAFLPKPFDKKALIENITRLLTPPLQRWTEGVPPMEYSLDLQIGFEGMPKGLGEAIDTKAILLGRGGMFVPFKKGEFPNVGDHVSFHIKFDGSSEPLEGRGVVRWVRSQEEPHLPSGCGIEFTYLSPAQRDFILKYLNKRKPKAFIPNE